MSIIRRIAKTTLRGLDKTWINVLDGIPAPIADPLDGRLEHLALALRSVATDWDIEPMKGMRCSRSLWLGHAAFAHSLVLYRKPKVIVDLGVFQGCSTFAMGLALKRLGSGRIYAVDCWEGDEHAGHYGEELYRKFLEERTAFGLEEYVVPMRMFFSEAAGSIDGPVDLLHVDGLHTFRAASDDFRLFRDRLTPGAVVLFHDVYNNEFPGLRVLWKLLSWHYRSYRLNHSSGLGLILARGGDRSLGLPRGLHVHERIRVIRRRIAENLPLEQT